MGGMGRFVGLSYDLKQVGLAVSDPSRTIASPLSSLSADSRLECTAKQVLQKIEELLGTDVEQLVLGLPLLMNGQMGFLGDEVSHLAEELEAQGPYSVLLWDARLASVQADRSIRRTSAPTPKRQKKHRPVTAALVLQGYLDHCKLREQINDELLVD